MNSIIMAMMIVCVCCLDDQRVVAESDYSPEEVQKGIEAARDILRLVGKRTGGGVQSDVIDTACTAATLPLMACAEIPACDAASLACTLYGPAKTLFSPVKTVTDWFTGLFG